jgi:NADH dehydrogenase
MMNPFIQHALDEVHTYPASSAILSEELSDPPSKKWALKRHPKSGGLMVDDRFRVKLVPRNGSPIPSKDGIEATMQDVFAIGDVSVLEKGRLPATAQVANQEASWLGKRMNKGDFDKAGFDFNNLGVMTYLGNWRAIMQADNGNGVRG